MATLAPSFPSLPTSRTSLIQLGEERAADARKEEENARCSVGGAGRALVVPWRSSSARIDDVGTGQVIVDAAATGGEDGETIGHRNEQREHL